MLHCFQHYLNHQQKHPTPSQKPKLTYNVKHNPTPHRASDVKPNTNYTQSVSIMFLLAFLPTTPHFIGLPKKLIIVNADKILIYLSQCLVCSCDRPSDKFVRANFILLNDHVIEDIQKSTITLNTEGKLSKIKIHS